MYVWTLMCSVIVGYLPSTLWMSTLLLILLVFLIYSHAGLDDTRMEETLTTLLWLQPRRTSQAYQAASPPKQTAWLRSAVQIERDNE